MSDDLIARLRATGDTYARPKLAYEAADEIKRLTEELAKKQEWISAQGAEMAKLYDAYGMVEAERDQLREDLGLANEVIETLEEQVSNARIAGRGIEIQRDALKAAIDKVLALHRKTTEEMLHHKCADGDCEHEDECPSILVDVCGCCAAIAQQVSDEYWPAAMDEITWPCPTYVALTQGREGS